MSNLYRGPSIDSSYQVSVHLAKQFQRRRYLKSHNQKQELPVVAMIVNEANNKISKFMSNHFSFLNANFPFLAHLAKGKVS
jgi:hypothetical protein